MTSRRAAGCDPRPCGHLPNVDFEELYRATYPRVLAYARSMASREDADDASPRPTRSPGAGSATFLAAPSWAG